MNHTSSSAGGASLSLMAATGGDSTDAWSELEVFSVDEAAAGCGLRGFSGAGAPFFFRLDPKKLLF